MSDHSLASSSFDWRRPVGLAELGIMCCTQIGATSMVGEFWLVGWQGLGSSRIDVAAARHQLQTGDVNFVQPHTAVSLQPHDGARYLALLVPPPAVASAAIDISGGAVTSPPPIVPVLRGHKLDSAGLRFYVALTESHEPLGAKIAWLELMAQILAAASIRPPVLRSDPAAVRRARDFLHDHPDELVSLDRIASAAGVSKFHLVRLFHAAVGMTPYRYHLCVRAERARTLLDGGAAPSEAAVAAGFFDQSHFTRVFKHIFGIPPGTYARVARCGSGSRAHPGSVSRRGDRPLDRADQPADVDRLDQVVVEA